LPTPSHISLHTLRIATGRSASDSCDPALACGAYKFTIWSVKKLVKAVIACSESSHFATKVHQQRLPLCPHGMGQARGGAATARATVLSSGRSTEPNFVGTFAWLLSEMTREEILYFVRSGYFRLHAVLRFVSNFRITCMSGNLNEQTRNFDQAFVGMYSAMCGKGDLGFPGLRCLRGCGKCGRTFARTSNVWWS
jgi:hypothetical protein